MISSLRHRLLVTALLASLAAPAAAQQDPHHPPGGTQPPRADQPTTPGGPGGMDMQAMMRRMMQDQGGMHRMSMMGLMGMGGMMSQMMSAMSGMPIERVEGHIAFIKAELKITEAQAKPWEAFAAALRANAKQLNELHAAHAKHGEARSTLQAIEMQEHMLAARLEVVRRTKAVLAPLEAVLSDDQKKSLAQLAMPRMGM